MRLAAELGDEGLQSSWYATGRRGVSSLSFRGYELSGSYTGFSDRPAYADARTIADDLIQAYVDGELDRVEIIYNAYISPLTQRVTRERLLPLSAGDDRRRGARSSEPARRSEQPRAAGARRLRARPGGDPQAPRARLRRDLDLPRAGRVHRGFFGAQMTAMRSASENAGEIITDYTLQMNRARQAEITQEIMEVVAGAEGLS